MIDKRGRDLVSHNKQDVCIFCDIAGLRIPSHGVYEDDTMYAFLDIHPIRPGHVQIIPRQHYSYFDEMPEYLASRIVILGQRLAAVLKRMYAVPRVGFMFTGGDVAHCHAHVVPLVEGTDITSRRYIAEERVTFRNTPRQPDSELKQIAQSIRGSLAG